MLSLASSGREASERDRPCARDRHYAGHLVSTDRELPFDGASAILESELVPATVPLIGPVSGPVSDVAWVVDERSVPVTFGPSCLSSRNISEGRPNCGPSGRPDHVPVTSTVTSVRSIQSLLAHPRRRAATP